MRRAQRRERGRGVEQRDGHGGSLRGTALGWCGSRPTGVERLPWAVVFAVVLVLASVTDKLATFATNVVGDLGLPGVFLLMVAESACIPIPSEATMLFAGFNVPQGEYSLFAAVLVGVGGEPRRLVDRLRDRLLTAASSCSRSTAQVLHIKPSHLAWADRWFERYGAPAVFFGRMLPIIRTFISLPAGVARMPFWRFTRAHVRRLPAVGLHADLHRPAGRRTTGRTGRTRCTTSTTRSRR